nr:MAG TPA: DNA-directed RNA polymerase [Caudoviricetes sp.]
MEFKRLTESNSTESKVDGIVEDIIVVTDPDITISENQKDIAQDIINQTEDGEIPFNEEYIGQYIQTCPICGSSFITKTILRQNDVCPICLDRPDDFVMVGRLEKETEEEQSEEQLI